MILVGPLDAAQLLFADEGDGGEREDKEGSGPEVRDKVLLAS